MMNRLLLIAVLLLTATACAQSVKERQRVPSNGHGPVASLGEDCYKEAVTSLEQDTRLIAALRRSAY